MGTHTKENAPRALLMAQLQPLLPDDWRLIKYEDNSDEPDRVLIKVRVAGVSRFKPAPRGFYDTEGTLELITPETDPAKAEDSLDVVLFELLDILDTINPNLWSNAKKVLDAGLKRLAYDITINFTTQKEQP